MRVGRTLGLMCGHSTEKEELEVDQSKDFLDSKYINFNCIEMLDTLDFHCKVCNDAYKAKRINIFVIERDPRIIV